MEHMQSFLEANKTIKEKAVKGGSTALVALFGAEAIHFANAGDCRYVSFLISILAVF